MSSNLIARSNTIAILAAALGASLVAAAPAAAGELALPLADHRPRVVRPVAPGLLLQVDRSEDGTALASWDVAVVARPGGENLLYESRFWHGPHPSQMEAWHLAEGFYPAERELPVRGRPWIVTIRCDGCETAGSGGHVVFTAGVLHVAWRRTR